MNTPIPRAGWLLIVLAVICFLAALVALTLPEMGS